ncbi:phage tail spike protein [Bacillus suaedae]|uniref:Phage tail protein n=1 Tax=Halalkalibacter suaedae TaxID=2822140 RepID=A0A940WPV6_9BACI|nr:phage tail spike protein [Bacillus suaedae]MBP3950345.1 phage tail protein [Bacillus suaedae]
MINVLHHQTDEIIGWINEVIEDSHKNDLENTETYDFEVSTLTNHVDKIDKRSRLLIPGEDGDYHEFIVNETVELTEINVKEVYAIGSHQELDKLKIIAPETREGETVKSAGQFVLDGIDDWQLGVVEYSGIHSWTIERYIGAWEALKAIASLFECELRFRIVVNGDHVTGRYVDFVKRRGLNRGREIRFGKDLVGIKRRILSERIVTALYCIGPEQQDGTRLTTTITNDTAYQNWNRKGEHLIELYEPESSDTEMTLDRLTQLGDTELKKRIDAAVEYELDAVSLEHIFGYEHEITRLGDSAKVKDEHFNPPMYLDSRVIFVDRSVFDESQKSFKLGEVVEYQQEDVVRLWKDLQAIYATKVVKSATAPQGKANLVWIQTGGTIDVVHTWNPGTGEWEKATSTTADEVGSYDKVTVDTKDENLYQDATVYTDTRVEQVKVGSESYTDIELQAQREALMLEIAEKAGLEYVDGKLLLKADNATVNALKGQVETLENDIALKADATWVDGQLQTKADSANTYTMTEVDNALDNKVAITTYTTDQQGIVTRFQSNETRLTQNEQDIQLRATKTQLEQVENDVGALGVRMSSAETAIDANAEQILLRASKTEVNTLSGEVSSLEATIQVQANEIQQRVTKTEFDGLTIGGRNHIQINKLTRYSPYNDIMSDGNHRAIITYKDYSSGFVTMGVSGFVPTNEEYTFSGYVKLNGSIVNPSTIFYGRSASTYAGSVTRFLTRDNGYIEITQKWSGNSGWILHTQWDPSLVAGDVVWIDRVKFEKGNKATEWTPAPEDIDSAINGLGTRLSTAESTITQQADLISQRVTKTAYEADQNSVVNRLTSAESLINQQADQIQQRVTQTTYDSGLSTKENSVLKQNSAPSHSNGRLWMNTSVTPNILYRSNGSAWVKVTPTTASEVGAYSSTDGSALAGRVSTAESTIKQQADQIEARVSKAEVMAWLNSYSVRYGAAVALTELDGSDLNPNYTYEVQGRTAGTGTNSLAIAYFKGDGTSFTVEIAYQRGNSSNHPRFFIASNGKPALETWHSNPYTVDVSFTKYRGDMTSFKVLSDGINLRVEKNGVIAAINLTSEGTRISGSKLHVDGNTTFSNDVTIKGTLSGVSGTFSGAISTNNLLIYSGVSGNQITFDSGAVLGRAKLGTIGNVNSSGAIVTPLYAFIAKSTSGGYSESFSNLASFQIYADVTNVRGDIRIEKASPTLTLRYGGSVAGNYPKITFETNNNQDVQLRFTEFDGDIPGGGYALILEKTPGNAQQSLGAKLIVEDYLYAKGVSLHGGVIETSTADSFNHAFLKMGTIGIVGLNGSTVKAQIRNAANTDYADLQVKQIQYQSMSQYSLREYKKNIVSVETSMRDIVESLNFYEFHYLSDEDHLKKHLGTIYDEAPDYLKAVNGDSIDMTKLMWSNVKATKELSLQVRAHDDEIEMLKIENQYLKQKVKCLEQKIA